jgi:hypothetical protein
MLATMGLTCQSNTSGPLQISLHMLKMWKKYINQKLKDYQKHLKTTKNLLRRVSGHFFDLALCCGAVLPNVV